MRSSSAPGTNTPNAAQPTTRSCSPTHPTGVTAISPSTQREVKAIDAAHLHRPRGGRLKLISRAA